MVKGGITSEEEEDPLAALNAGVESTGLPLGTLTLVFADAATGPQLAVFDLA